MASEVESRAGESEGEAEGDLEDVASQPLDDTPPQQEDATPHPARRPMNAFLIFCKRHRAQVREKYPHLENRQVTKILGEWWADLPAHQKTSYTDLARQYKEAFLRANPDFKWYKIPAQPPRPPPARPSNQKVPRCDPLPTDGAITFGKLADEAQMGGLSTLLSTASSTCSSSNNNSTCSSISSSSIINNNSNSIGALNLGAISPVYISTSNTLAGCALPPPSLPTPPSSSSSSCVSSLSSVASLTPIVPSFSNSVTVTSSMSTNTSSGTNLLWSESLRRPGLASAPITTITTTPTTCSSPRTPITNTSVDFSASVTAIPVTPPPVVGSVTTTTTTTTMTPPKPPKKRYLHENSLTAAHTPVVATPTHSIADPERKKSNPTVEEKFKSSPNWVFGKKHKAELHKNRSKQNGPEPEQKSPIIIPPVCVSLSSPVTTSPSQNSTTSPRVSFPASQIRVTPSHQRSTANPQQCSEQPLNLSTETTNTYTRSQQQLINNIVERMCNGPSADVRSDSQSKFERFFRPQNLNNNIENEKPAIHKMIDSRINNKPSGMCNVTLLVSKAIDLVIDRAVDSDKLPKKENILSEGCKNLFAEAGKSQNTSSSSVNSKDIQQAQEARDLNDSVTSTISDSNGITQPSARPRKRAKGESSEESEVAPKKKKEMTSVRSSHGNTRVGVAGGRRSRVPRKCKGKRYEELISEGVLQAPRRSRTRNSRWEEAESSRMQENEEEENVEDPQPQDVDDEDNDEDSANEEEVSHAKASEDENGETGRSRSDEGRRRGQRQLRRLRPDDFDLEARIEALPSLCLDDFTRRKKEKKKTSSASSTISSTTVAQSHPPPISTITSVTNSSLSTQPSMGVVSSSRITVPADSTSDPSTTTTITSGPWTNTTIMHSRMNGTNVSSTNGTGMSDGEAASPTPSSSSSTSSTWSQMSPQVPLFVSGGSLSPGETPDAGPLIGSQKRKARKQTITRHDPLHAPLRRDTSVVEQSVLTNMGLVALAEVALSQPSMKI